MELSTFTLRVVLLFFPGVLCALLVDSLTAHRERTPAQFLTNAFVLGVGSYLLLYTGWAVSAGGAALLGLPAPPHVSFFVTLLDGSKSLAGGEIALTGLIAILLGGIASAAINHKVAHRVARRLRLSRAFGDLDVWALMFNSPETTWITVRDQAHQLTYFGWVEAFSDTYDKAELLLGQVEVFDSATGGKLYGADRVYLARPAEALTIEPLGLSSRPLRRE
ncbi:DUF6338 family protein [Longimicrobium sp.]|jgi:hypothetical protein|uniref:DUF6338 family protein n=1 Tax=Longimicrobium sp. TaxID=2029185 RepID=UPI002EDA3350